MKIVYRVFSLLWLLLPCSVQAQTVVWQMQPGDYSELTHLTGNIYVAKHNEKVGLVRADGSVVSPVANVQIGDFYENKALVTYADGQRECVRGVLTDDGTYLAFSTKYYTLSGQKFYSDGLLSVADAAGRLGYVDAYGNKALGFDGKYDKIKPFTEGYAAVFKNKQYSLIDKGGSPVAFTFKGVAELYGGTNVINGKAYVWDTNGKLYAFDTSRGGTCDPVKWPGSKALDYLYRFAALSGKTKEVPFYKAKADGQKGVAPDETNNLYGFKFASGVAIPAQFSKATQFEDNLSVVCLNGKFGILRLVDGACFQAASANASVGYYAGEKAKCSFQLTVPDAWKGKKLDVMMKNGEQTVALVPSASEYSFELHPDREQYSFTVEVACEGLLLYQTSLSYAFVMKKRCPVCKLDVTQCKYHGKHPAPEKTSTVKENHEQEKKVEAVCPTCGKKISECKYQGVH